MFCIGQTLVLYRADAGSISANRLYSTERLCRRYVSRTMERTSVLCKGRRGQQPSAEGRDRSLRQSSQSSLSVCHPRCWGARRLQIQCDNSAPAALRHSRFVPPNYFPKTGNLIARSGTIWPHFPPFIAACLYFADFLGPLARSNGIQCSVTAGHSLTSSFQDSRIPGFRPTRLVAARLHCAFGTAIGRYCCRARRLAGLNADLHLPTKGP